MITDERIASFINSFNNDYDDAITAIRKEAEEQGDSYHTKRGRRIYQASS